MENASLYSEARNEYLKQMSTWLVPPLVEFFRKEYNTLAETEGRKVMSAFQTYCSEVPLWNQDVIDSNIGIILDNCRCDYMEELMTAVFIAYTKMLTAIRVSARQKKLQITLPKLDHFLHRVFIECARSFWKAPYLFAQDLTPVEKQKNILQAEQICTEALSGAVRSLLPVKSILRDYLDDGEDEEDEKVTEKVVEDEEPVKEESVKEEPVKEEPIKEEPIKEEPVKEEPVKEEPVKEEVKEIVQEAPKIVVEEEVKSVKIVETPKVIAEIKTASEPVEEVKPEPVKEPVVIQKLNTDPAPPTIVPSEHAITDVPVVAPIVNISKEGGGVGDSGIAVAVAEPISSFKIDTEPAVHFAEYDSVFDETTKDISHIRYSPKDSDFDEQPRLSFGETLAPIAGDDVEDLEPVEDIDAPLGTTGDFEVLA